MMPTRIFRPTIIITLIAIGSCVTVFAQSKQYIVEVAVFGHEIQHFSSEIWKQTYLDVHDNLQRKGDEINFVEEGPMNAAVEALQRRRDYTVFHYSAWVQDTLQQRDAPVVAITSPMANLRGNLQIYGGQLLFVDLMLRYSKPPSLNALTTAPFVFTIDEKRRLKLNETHYFDHPHFGAILRVSRQPFNAR